MSSTESKAPEINDAISHRYLYSNEGEINLLDIWDVLLRRKRFLLVTTFLVAAAISFATLAISNVYQTTAILLPPNPRDIEYLNIPEVSEVEPALLFERFINGLSSQELRKRLFIEEKIIKPFNNDGSFNQESLEILDKFNQAISVKPRLNAKGKYIESVSISMTGKAQPSKLASIINKLVALAEKEACLSTISDVNKKLEHLKGIVTNEITLLREKAKKQRIDKIKKLEETDHIQRKLLINKINSLRTQAKLKRLDLIVALEEEDLIERNQIKEEINVLLKYAKEVRQDRLFILQEAQKIASNLSSQDTPQMTFLFPGFSQNIEKTDAPITHLSPLSVPLYLMGEKALQAEINELTIREYDEPFIDGLRSLQAKLTMLEKNERIDVIKHRQNDDPFIKQLRELEAQLAQLETNNEVEILKARQDDDPFILNLRDLEAKLETLGGVQINPKTIRAICVDQPAYPGEKPVRPRRILISAVGCLIALIFAVILTLFIDALTTRKTQINNLS